MSSRSPITTHVLNTATGRPVVGIAITLYRRASASDVWQEIGSGVTDADGRASQLLPPGTLTKQDYRLTFGTGSYFAEQGIVSLYPEVSIEFCVIHPDEHYHIPLLVSPFSFSTYRGS